MLKAFAAAGKAVEFVDVRERPLDRAFLAGLLAVHGDRVVNTRSATWRMLDEADRARDPLELLSEHPTLMKRPVIDTGSSTFVGWSDQVRASLIE